MFEAARSFTDPPGLNHSALAKSSMPGRSRVNRSRRNSGVLPMSSRLRPPRELTTGRVSAAARAGVDESGTSVRPVESGGINLQAEPVTIVMYSQLDYRLLRLFLRL